MELFILLTWLTPASTSASIWWSIIGLLANSTSGLALDSVNGRSRVPYPPTNIRAFILLSRAVNMNLVILLSQSEMLKNFHGFQIESWCRTRTHLYHPLSDTCCISSRNVANVCVYKRKRNRGRFWDSTNQNSEIKAKMVACILWRFWQNILLVIVRSCKLTKANIVVLKQINTQIILMRLKCLNINKIKHKNYTILIFI